MAKFDNEVLLNAVVQYLKDNLTAKLAEIDAEKADGITLTPVSADAFFVHTLDDEVTNYNPFIYVGFSSLGGSAIQGSTAFEPRIQVTIVMSASTETQDDFAKILRYQRALVEIFNEGFSRIRSEINLTIENLEPVTLQGVNTSNLYRAIGIEMQTTFAP